MVGELRKMLGQGGSCGECWGVRTYDRSLRRKRSSQLKRQEQAQGSFEAQRPRQSEDMNVFAKENSLRAFQENNFGRVVGKQGAASVDETHARIRAQHLHDSFI